MNHNSDNRARMNKSITVLLLRHGEREDEAEKMNMSIEERKRYALVPRQAVETIDPYLTERGYEQAMNAWTNILSAIQHKHEQQQKYSKGRPYITVVCSPLRRCIGTALMSLSLSSFHFPIPHSLPTRTDANDASIESNGNNPTEANQDQACETTIDCWTSFRPYLPDTISNNSINENHGSNVVERRMINDETTITMPILVMNGFAASAAAIDRFGGVTAALQCGHNIPCAVTDEAINDNRRFNEELDVMIRVAQSPLRTMVQSQQQQQSPTHTATTTVPVQYYCFQKYDNDQHNGIINQTKCITPMSSVITTIDTTITFNHSNSSLLTTMNSDNHIIDNSNVNNVHINTTPDNDNNNYSSPIRTRDGSDTTVTTTSNTLLSTPPRSIQPKIYSTTTNTKRDSKNNSTNNMDETFFGALNHTVQMTMNSTNENDSNNNNNNDHVYLIVVTHRESIRTLIEHCYMTSSSSKLSSKQTKRQRGYYKTPYCCIGIFTATQIDNSNNNDNNQNHKSNTQTSMGIDKNIEYTFHNVSSYEDFSCQSI